MKTSRNEAKKKYFFFRLFFSFIMIRVTHLEGQLSHVAYFGEKRG